MTSSPETKTSNNIERHNLKRAGGMQYHLIDPNTVFVPENVVRHEEVWNRDVTFLFPTDERIRYHKFNGDHFIKSYRKVNRQSKVRWSRPEDLEAGIRFVDHIREAYDPRTGREIKKTRHVITLIKDLSVNLQRPELKPLDMQFMAQQVVTTLAGAGFVDAQKDTKQEIVNKIMKAASLDSLARVNSPRSRLILSHAWVDLIRELLVGKVTENKYARIGAKLIRERELERFVLSQTVAHINELIGGSSSFEDKRNARELKEYVRQFLSRDVVKLKPYAKIAAISRFFIMNTGSRQEFDLLMQYIGDEASIYYGTKPFTQLDRRERIRRLEGIKSRIEEGLDIGELFLHTKTSERAQTLEHYRVQKGITSRA